jgi:hypothetical protein
MSVVFAVAPVTLEEGDEILRGLEPLTPIHILLR